MRVLEAWSRRTALTDALNRSFELPRPNWTESSGRPPRTGCSRMGPSRRRHMSAKSLGESAGGLTHHGWGGGYCEGPKAAPGPSPRRRAIRAAQEERGQGCWPMALHRRREPGRGCRLTPSPPRGAPQAPGQVRVLHRSRGRWSCSRSGCLAESKERVARWVGAGSVRCSLAACAGRKGQPLFLGGRYRR